MTIFDYDHEIQRLIEDVDPVTGEFLHHEELMALLEGKEAEIEGLALYIKSLSALSKALKEEMETLAKRKKTAENAEKRAKEYLQLVLHGEKLTTSKVAVSYRKSKSVEITDDKKIILKFMTKKETYAPDKKAIKEAIEKGEIVDGASLVESVSMTVK